jgi:hypothetical protein
MYNASLRPISKIIAFFMLASSAYPQKQQAPSAT